MHNHKNSIRIWAITFAIGAAAAVVSAAPRDRNPPPPPREKEKTPPPPQPPTTDTPLPAEPKHFPDLKTQLSDQADQINKDLAARMLRRGAGGAASPQAELSIDLRIIRRWCLAQAAAAKPESDLQIALLLRAMQLDAATT